jgi:uncharacterized protein
MPTTFEYRSRFNAPASAVFSWHEAPGAFERLTPPWLDVEVLERKGGIDGGTVVLKIAKGPAQFVWKLAHDQYEKGIQFRDHQIEGPFKSWHQIHHVEPDGPDACFLTDTVNFELPDYVPVKFLAGEVFVLDLRRLFQYRHRIIAEDFDLYGAGKEQGMKILVSGSTGMVGSSLIPLLTTQGHSATCLVRPQSKPSPEATPKIEWEPKTGTLDPTSLEGFDGIVHLAGDSIASKWTDEKKMELRNSRILGTRLLSETIAKLKNKPKVLVAASAIGYYGDRGDETLDETSRKGTGFLSDLCEDWETSAKPAIEAGIRVVNLRIGVVLSTKGGALKQMLLPFQLGAGGQIGNGKQYFSWIAIDDLCGAIIHCLNHEELKGPVNGTAPNPVTNEEFTKALGAALFRPTLIPIPPFGLRLMFGEMADELLIAGQRVIPSKLQNSGYNFRQTEIEPALRQVLGS